MNKKFAQYTRSIAFSISLSKKMIDKLFHYPLFSQKERENHKLYNVSLREPCLTTFQLIKRGLIKENLIDLTEVGEALIPLLEEAGFSSSYFLSGFTPTTVEEIREIVTENKFAQYSRSTVFCLTLSFRMIESLFFLNYLKGGRKREFEKYPDSGHIFPTRRALERRGLFNLSSLTKAGKLLIPILDEAGFKEKRLEIEKEYDELDRIYTKMGLYEGNDFSVLATV